MQIVTSGPSSVRYLGLISSARDAADSASSRVIRLVAEAKVTPLAEIGSKRLVGAVMQADKAMQLIAMAERYRMNESVTKIPSGAVKYALQALEDLDSGSRALRRATALIADPQIDNDPVFREATIRSISLAESHYRMAEWLLAQAPLAGDSTEVPTVIFPERADTYIRW